MCPGSAVCVQVVQCVFRWCGVCSGGAVCQGIIGCVSGVWCVPRWCVCPGSVMCVQVVLCVSRWGIVWLGNTSFYGFRERDLKFTKWKTVRNKFAKPKVRLLCKTTVNNLSAAHDHVMRERERCDTSKLEQT